MFKYEYTKLFVLGMILGAIVPIGVLIFDILSSPKEANKEAKKQTPIIENDPKLPVLENDPKSPVSEILSFPKEAENQIPTLENTLILGDNLTLRIAEDSNLRSFSDIPFRSIDDIAFVAEQVRKGANFAWHYRIVEWGCGTECQTGVIVDTRNNSIYAVLPTSSYGRKYSLDSNLLIVNPPEDILEGIPDWPFNEYYYWLTTEYYIWGNNRFQKIK